MTALPANLARRVESALARDGYPRVRLLTAPRVLVAWWLVGGGQAAKRAALDRLLETSSQVRWVLVGDDGGPDRAMFADLAARAPGRVAAIGLRQTLERRGPLREPQPVEHVHGVPVVQAPNGEELLPGLRTAAGDEPPRGAAVQR